MPLAALGWNDQVAALFAEIAGPGLVPARVVRVERSACIIATDRDEHVAQAPRVLAVGDWVAAQVPHNGAPDNDTPDSGAPDGGAMVVGVVPAWSRLTRIGPGGVDQVLAANVDVVFVTAPADRLSPARVEREAAMAWDSGARPVVLVTKADVAGAEQVAGLRRRLVTVDVVATSVRTGAGLQEVRQLLQPCRTAVLLGPSGAGKSSLANALVGGEPRLATTEVREGDHRGRHTTTSRQLLVVPGGGVLIDTPGLRSLSLAGTGAGIAAAFDDIVELAATCRFRNCRHLSEPRCAVTAAIASGRLDPDRLANYRKLQGEIR